MSFRHNRVDLSANLSYFPEKLKGALMHLGEKHNELVEDTNEMKRDLDQLGGETLEVKTETYQAIALLRNILGYLHGKRFHAVLFTVQTYFLLNILKQLHLAPERLDRLLDALISLIQKFN